MARKIRIEYAEVAYHAMAHGNQGRDTSADDLTRIPFARGGVNRRSTSRAQSRIRRSD